MVLVTSSEVSLIHRVAFGISLLFWRHLVAIIVLLTGNPFPRYCM